jgi:hypothetical protein
MIAIDDDAEIIELPVLRDKRCFPDLPLTRLAIAAKRIDPTIILIY